MEKRRLVNKTEMGKENFKRISSKQLEAHTGGNCHEHIVVDRYTVLGVEQ